MKKLLTYLPFLSVGFLALILAGSACKKQHIQDFTTSETNIVDYMRKRPEQFSEFLKILDKTNVSPFLNAYGAYTVFAPDNNAVNAYLKETGKSSIDQIDTAELRGLVQLHLIRDTLSTTKFTDGRMPTPTMYGQYLTSNVNERGQTVLNRRSIIIQQNTNTGNGIIHVIDKVLIPAKLTLMQTIEQNSNYSIFTQALKATKLDSLLSITKNPDTTNRWFTLLAVPDSVYRKDTSLVKTGIQSFSDLQNRFTPDSLYLYTAYHILFGIKYVADVASAPSHPTLAPKNVVTTTLTGQTVMLNDATFNGMFEAGVAVDRPQSDVAATNGVMHSLLGDIYIKVRTPVGVYFDVADQPEIRKNVAVFRKQGKSVQFSVGQLSEVTWQQGLVQYTVESATSTNYFYWDDHLDFALRATSSVNNWIEFTTPLIVAGTYKVWICYRRNAHGLYTQASFDGNPMSRIIDLNAYLPSKTASDAVLETQGFKRYNYQAPLDNTTQNAQFAGIVKVETTDRHKIRLTCIKDNGSGSGPTGGVNLDMIQFIPADNPDQQWPRFGRDGSIKLTP